MGASSFKLYELIASFKERRTYRSLILETCSEIWKFSLQRDNDVEV